MSDIIFENRTFRMVLGQDSILKSLINLSNGEECLADSIRLPLFSATQDRPFNNEIKLAHMNKHTTFKSNKASLSGNRLSVGFELFPFSALIDVDVKDEYIAFTLSGFEAEKDSYPMPMDYPPVTELSLIELPVNKSNPYGEWMNVSHTEKSSVAVMGACPQALIESETFGDVRVLKGAARKGIKLVGCTVALILSDTDKILDAVRSLEYDFGLPHGVDSRRSDIINSSIYWTPNLNPSNVDEHISYAKSCGYKLMLLYYTCMFDAGKNGYEKCGDYDYNERYPNGEADMRLIIEKLKSAGITPGIHFLHTHIGVSSRYVTPKADRRLHLIRHFTLSKPIQKDGGDTIYVDEAPIDCPSFDERSRLLRFDGEIISYESYSTEYPYCFKGCKRGHFGTEITEHKEYTIGGILDVSEFGGTSIYLDQSSDIQDEIGDKLSRLYDLGFEFIYFDGSEGTNAPFDYHVSNAQYRIYKKLKKAPHFCEGAAKTHFGWHMLSGGNAFDIFPTEIFKKMIIEHPFKEAQMMRKDFTRVNFGWWWFGPDSRVDVFEFGTSKAASYDCPVTLMSTNIKMFTEHPRREDIFEMLRRWEDIRAKKWLTDEHKAMLRDENAEHTLLINADGEYELLPYEEIKLPESLAPLRAFVFEYKGDSHAVIWTDHSKYRLEIASSAVSAYTNELETKPISYEIAENNAILPVENRAYIRSELTKSELISAITSAKISTL